jgi:hypothetical protein
MSPAGGALNSIVKRHEVNLAEEFRSEALCAIDAQIASLRATLDFTAASSLPHARSLDIVLAGREAQLTIFRQNDQPSPGKILVTAQVARHSLGGVTSLHFEKGLVISPDGVLREATDLELLISGG